MLKIVFALQIAVAAAFGLSASTSTSTSTSAPTEQGAGAVLSRVGCSVCAENYDNCISEGIAPASCQRLAAFCYKNCLN